MGEPEPIGAEVPWYPENDEAQWVVVPQEDELVMEASEYEQGSETDTEHSRKQRRESWPINKGLPSTSDIAAAQEERDVTSRQYLSPPPSDIREGFSALRVPQDIPRSCPTLVEPSSTGERGLDSQTAQGARPKETGHRSRLSTAARNLENRED